MISVRHFDVLSISRLELGSLFSFIPMAIKCGLDQRAEKFLIFSRLSDKKNYLQFYFLTNKDGMQATSSMTSPSRGSMEIPHTTNLYQTTNNTSTLSAGKFLNNMHQFSHDEFFWPT